jgi:hypothetical protein
MTRASALVGTSADQGVGGLLPLSPAPPEQGAKLLADVAVAFGSELAVDERLHWARAFAANATPVFKPFDAGASHFHRAGK